jgi:hypothetical protein
VRAAVFSRAFSGNRLSFLRKKSLLTGLAGGISLRFGKISISTLCIAWLFLNFLDVAISGLALSAGASEIGILFPLAGDWNLFILLKIGIAALVGLYLTGTGRRAVLTGITSGMAVICMYNGLVLAVSVMGPE